MTMTNKFILEGKKPMRAKTLEEWAVWFQTAYRYVSKTYIGDIFISTVFLGIDHSFYAEDTPILFETMVFGGPLDQEQQRYATWEEAEEGHSKMVERVIKEIANASH